jgi:hypothetical protein
MELPPVATSAVPPFVEGMKQSSSTVTAPFCPCEAVNSSPFAGEHSHNAMILSPPDGMVSICEAVTPKWFCHQHTQRWIALEPIKGVLSSTGSKQIDALAAWLNRLAAVLDDTMPSSQVHCTFMNMQSRLSPGAPATVLSSWTALLQLAAIKPSL